MTANLPTILTPDKMTEEQKSARRVVCAALQRNVDGQLIIGPRHFDPTMHRQISNDVLTDNLTTGRDAEILRLEWDNAKQGFIDNFGNFLTRTEAWWMASAAGQIIRLVGGQKRGPFDQELYSENLY